MKNNVIIVIGGNGYLGKSIVNDLNNYYTIVIVADLFIDENNDKHFKINITKDESLVEFINIIKNKYGKIDAVINTAYPKNKNYGNHFFDVKFNDFCENVNLHLGGYFLVSQKFADFFKNQGYGNIINISSIYGVIPPKFDIYNNTEMTVPIEYSCIKSAIIMLDKYLSNYLKGCNIKINTISPGGIFANQDDEFIKNYNLKCANKGMLDPSDINGTIRFLLSNDSNFITGQNLIVDDGYVLN